jgi:hypothetical protein
VLKTEAEGGERKDKRIEVFLKTKGLLAANQQVITAERGLAEAVDKFGNLKGSYAKKIIGYFSKSSQETRKLLRVKKNKKTNFKRVVLGFRMFVVNDAFAKRRGKLPNGLWIELGGQENNKTKILPILWFKKNGQYKRILRMENIIQDAQAQDILSRRTRYEIRRTFEQMGK